MEPLGERAEGELAQEPFPPTETTLTEPAMRGELDDRRLGDREVGSSLRDQEIAGNALFALAEDGHLDLGDGLMSRITVKVEGRIATISGVVESLEQKMIAEELVETIPGVRLVQNALTVAADGYLDDGDLDRQVRERLDGAGLAAVGSRVSHGVARLVGTVRRLADEERAVRVAAAVRGLRDLVSSLKVSTPENTDDLDLKSLVGQTLALNDVVMMDRRVLVRNGIVEIAGRVKSLADCRRIRRLISDIEGVRGVRTRIRVDQPVFRDFQARTHLSTGR